MKPRTVLQNEAVARRRRLPRVAVNQVVVQIEKKSQKATKLYFQTLKYTFMRK